MAGILIGILAGISSGFFGIGGAIILVPALVYLFEPSGSFSFYSSPRVHPEARRAEGSSEILRRFAPQDEGSKKYIEKTPRPLIYLNFLSIMRKGLL